MAEDGPSNEVQTITFNIKSSADQKFTLSVPDSMTVADVKQKLSTSDYADIPAERQRLIYSGRVLKDPDTLASYRVKDGNTVHMVKQAASNTRQNPANQGSPANVPPGAGTTNTPGGVPSNIASGTGHDPLAGLTGARYAGFAQMPGANMFGPDGGMGPPQGPEEILRMLENPMFASQMNEAMNNPQVIQQMQNSPTIRDQPFVREMLNNPEMRRMMMDPQFIRQSMRMQRMMGGDNQGEGSMPAPGVTNTTPHQNNDTNSNPNSHDTATQQQVPPNPFAMFGQQPGAGNQANPFATLFGGGAMMNPPHPAPSGTDSVPNDETAQSGQNQGQQSQGQQPPNPLSMFGAPPAAGQGDQQDDMIMSMARQMMQNPEMMRMAMNSMGGMGGMGVGNDGSQQNSGAAGAGASGTGMGGAGPGGTPSFNPFAMLGGAPYGMPPVPPPDSRPPEEQYAEQLRQLNDMGFFEFDRNVRALRMSGGLVEGALEMLLGGGV